MKGFMSRVHTVVVDNGGFAIRLTGELSASEILLCLKEFKVHGSLDQGGRDILISASEKEKITFTGHATHQMRNSEEIIKNFSFDEFGVEFP